MRNYRTAVIFWVGFGECFDGGGPLQLGLSDGAEGRLPVRFVQLCACLDGFSESAAERAERWSRAEGSKPIFAGAQAPVPAIGNGAADRRKSPFCGFAGCLFRMFKGYAECFLVDYFYMVAYVRALGELDFEEADNLLLTFSANRPVKESVYWPIYLMESLFCDALFGRIGTAEEKYVQIQTQPLLKRYWNANNRIRAAYAFFCLIDLGGNEENIGTWSSRG